VSGDPSLDVRYNLSAYEDPLLHCPDGTVLLMLYCVAKFTECEVSEDKVM
jgi:hypothetical protein